MQWDAPICIKDPLIRRKTNSILVETDPAKLSIQMGCICGIMKYSCACHTPSDKRLFVYRKKEVDNSVTNLDGC